MSITYRLVFHTIQAKVSPNTFSINCKTRVQRQQNTKNLLFHPLFPLWRSDSLHSVFFLGRGSSICYGIFLIAPLKRLILTQIFTLYNGRNEIASTLDLNTMTDDRGVHMMLSNSLFCGSPTDECVVYLTTDGKCYMQLSCAGCEGVCHALYTHGCYLFQWYDMFS